MSLILNAGMQLKELCTRLLESRNGAEFEHVQLI